MTDSVDSAILLAQVPVYSVTGNVERSTDLSGQKQTFLEQSIGMRESQDASVSVLWVGDGLEPKVGELCGNFSSALKGFGFNHEGGRAPSHNGDVSSIAKLAGGIEPPRILGPGKERHRGSI